MSRIWGFCLVAWRVGGLCKKVIICRVRVAPLLEIWYLYLYRKHMYCKMQQHEDPLQRSNGATRTGKAMPAGFAMVLEVSISHA